MTLETVSACPVCGSYIFNDFLQCQDFTTTNEIFKVVQCPSCSLLLTNPRPDENNIGKYYESDTYISHSGKSEGILTRIYRVARNKALAWKYQIISSYKKSGHLLDIGCGTGQFLEFMHSRHWQVAGVEPNSIARQKSLLLTQARIEKSVEDFHQQFDVITLWHVLEHLHHPNQQLEKIKTLLKPDGVIFVAVPNPESYDAKKYKEYWAGYDVPRHLWHFPQSSVNKLMENHQLKIKEKIPMTMDAYYVSLLSERYQGKPATTAYVNALRTGIKSNRAARNDMNYSSLLYVITHEI